MRPTILLFDIDGTLITTGGAGRRAFSRTLGVLFGQPNACDHLSFGGMTDRALARLALEQVRAKTTESHIDSFLETYLTHLEAEVSAADAQRYRVHTGMVEAIESARSLGFGIGLGTGNIQRGAMVKLRRVGLTPHFHFGGFGDDHEHRAELIRIGAERGASHLGVALTEARVVIIGDTPKDISAAQAIGAQSLTVATGGHSVTELRALGATWAFDHLGVEGALEVLLTDSQ
jgi:phosphoglycolate phosphatase-like HAD superfamily hydrolase